LYALEGSLLTYVRWKIRIPRTLGLLCRGLAEREGWQIADLLRALLLLSATTKFLYLPKDETFKKLVELSRYSVGRAYSISGAGVTVLIDLRLPEGFAKMITAYADRTRRSRNDTVRYFIQAGLIMYLKAETSLINTLPSLNETAPADLSFSQRTQSLDKS